MTTEETIVACMKKTAEMMTVATLQRRLRDQMKVSVKQDVLKACLKTLISTGLVKAGDWQGSKRFYFGGVR